MTDAPIKIEAPALVVAPANTPRLQEPVTPNTTLEEDKHSRVMRDINVIWEVTQALIAVVVTGSVIGVASVLALRDGPQAQTAFLFLTGLTTLVMGFYFGRTNHARAGGVARS